jgi:hypothetical protein
MTTVNHHDKGDLVRLSGAFTDANDAAIDPGVVIFKYKNPSGTTTTKTYVTDPEVVKDSTGNYHIDIDANESGYWHYAVESTGSGQAAGEGTFYIKPRRV